LKKARFTRFDKAMKFAKNIEKRLSLESRFSICRFFTLPVFASSSALRKGSERANFTPIEI